MAELKLDQGVIDLVIKSVIAAAVAVLGYFGNLLLDRIAGLERQAQESKDRAYRLELMMRTEMVSREEFKEFALRIERVVATTRTK